MKYNDTYSMIGAMLNQGFETEFKKEREKKEKRRRLWQKLVTAISHLKKTFHSTSDTSENTSGSTGTCRCNVHMTCICAADCCDRV